MTLHCYLRVFTYAIYCKILKQKYLLPFKFVDFTTKCTIKRTETYSGIGIRKSMTILIYKPVTRPYSNCLNISDI